MELTPREHALLSSVTEELKKQLQNNKSMMAKYAIEYMDRKDESDKEAYEGYKSRSMAIVQAIETVEHTRRTFVFEGQE